MLKKSILYYFLYRAHCHSLVNEDRILALKLKSDALREKVGFISYICFSCENLRGLELIGNLKKSLIVANQPSEYLLLLSLLNAVIRSLFR